MNWSMRLGKQYNEKQVEVDHIRTDLDTQARVALAPETVESYAELMRDGISFPRILLLRDKEIDGYIMIDGWHRLDAHKLAHPDFPIKAMVIDGTLEDAQWISCQMNSDHGLQRSNADKNRVVRLALQHPKGSGKSNREIAQHVGVDEKLVRRVRKELESTAALPQSAKRAGRDGRVIDTEKIGKVKQQASGQAKADNLPVIEPSVPVQQVDEINSDEFPAEETLEQDCSPPDVSFGSEYEQKLTRWLPLRQDRKKGTQPENTVHVPISDSDRLVACLFELFDTQFREKVLDTLARAMLQNDGEESVLKVITPLCGDIRKM